MEITGTVQKILDPQTGESKNGTWQKQEFVIETKGEYPKSVCMNVWGDKVDEVKKLSVGDEITASINIESREYNSRWYTDVKCWKITSESNETNTTESEQEKTPIVEGQDDLPFIITILLSVGTLTTMLV